MQEFGAFFIFIFLSFIFGICMIVCSEILAPKTNNKAKKETYECGITVDGDSRVKFKIQFLTYAVLFLIFDIETVFLFPFALSFDVLGVFALVEVLIFLALLLLGLIYIIQKRVIRFR